MLEHRSFYPFTKRLNQLRGVAIIMALFVVALTSIIATGLIVGAQNQIQGLMQQQAADTGYWEMTYVPLWVKAQALTMQQDLVQQKKAPLWPAAMPTLSFANGDQLNANFLPANSRLNINNLGQPISNYLQIFVNLLQVVKPTLSAADAQQIALNVQAWLLPDQAQQETNSDYFPAHQLMVNVSELRLVEGMTADLYQKIAPYLITLPGSNTLIDVNSAKATLLAALLNKDQSAADTIVQYRKTQGSFPDVQTFTGLPSVSSALLQNQNLASLISVGIPQYLLAQATVQQGKAKVYKIWILQFDPERKTIRAIDSGQTL